MSSINVQIALCNVMSHIFKFNFVAIRINRTSKTSRKFTQYHKVHILGKGIISISINKCNRLCLLLSLGSYHLVKWQQQKFSFCVWLLPALYCHMVRHTYKHLRQSFVNTKRVITYSNL